MRVLAGLVCFSAAFLRAHSRKPRYGLATLSKFRFGKTPSLIGAWWSAPDGMIGFPLVGQIRASWPDAKGLEDVLRARLAKNYTGQLDVTVALAAVNRESEEETKPKVYITGEVLRPGPYFVRPTINVMQAIALAGGLGRLRRRQRIQLHRKVNGVDSIFIFDYNSYHVGGQHGRQYQSSIRRHHHRSRAWLA